jgi:hypothetical protein
MILLKGNQQHPLAGAHEFFSFVVVTVLGLLSGMPQLSLARQYVSLLIN